jgi:hypothetical protein
MSHQAPDVPGGAPIRIRLTRPIALPARRGGPGSAAHHEQRIQKSAVGRMV